MSGQHRISKLSSWPKPFDDLALLWLQFERSEISAKMASAQKNPHNFAQKRKEKEMREARVGQVFRLR
jgi:hypothetical protein